MSVLAFATVGAPAASAGTVTTPNSCTNNAQPGTSALPITLSGDAVPDPAALGTDDVTLAGASFSIDVPAATLLAGYGLGLLTAGTNNIPATVNLTLLGSNTTEGSQDLPPLDVVGTTTITDPTPANKTSGDESATPLSVTADLPTTTWTPAAPGELAISLGQSSTSALVAGGIITVTFQCTPGNPGPAGCGEPPAADCTTTIAVPAAPFTTVTVTGAAEPTAPVCTSFAAEVGIGGSLAIDLGDHCTDANGDIDESTFSLGTPSAGSLTPGATDGTYTYTPPDAVPAAPVVLDFSVADDGGLTSETAQLTITVVEASAPECTDLVVSGTVGDIPVDLTKSCTDADGDIDLTTFELTPALAPGSTPGTFVFKATEPGTTVVAFTVADETGLTSESADVTITATATPTTPPPTTPPPTTPPPAAGPVDVTGTAAYVATCRNTATPDESELTFEVTGTTTSPVAAGSPVVLKAQSWTVTVPASVIQTGMGLFPDDLKPGGFLSATATVKVFASNTAEGTLASSPIAVSVGPLAVDGSGAALPASTTFDVPDMSWTAVGGDVGFAMAEATVEVTIGPLAVGFTCVPKDGSLTIVTAVVTGETDTPAAGRDGTQVLGTTAARSNLPRTGADSLAPAALAIGLIDVGYLLASATRPVRRRRPLSS